MKIKLTQLFLFLIITLNAQEFKLYEKAIFIYENDTLGYRVLKPLGYEINKQYPVHLVLHGSGERGSDNSSQLTHGGGLFLKKEARENYPSWVIFPQCSENDRWPSLLADRWNEPLTKNISKPNKSLGLVIKLMDQFVQKIGVDKARVYVSGLSMGGMGTFEILHRRPNMFAAATPICGNGVTKLAKLYANKTPVWIFHGSDDNVVSPTHSLKMAKAIIKAGGSPKLTLYENVGHNSWNNAFSESDFLEWIHSKTNEL